MTSRQIYKEKAGLVVKKIFFIMIILLSDTRDVRAEGKVS